MRSCRILALALIAGSAGAQDAGTGQDVIPGSSLVEVQGGAKIMHCVAGKPEVKVLVASSGGYGFICSIGDMVSNRRAGREFMTIEPGETPLAPFIYEDA